MDPDALLAAALDAAERIRHRIDHSTLPIDPDVADTLVSSVQALNEWLSRGGFLPAAWQPAPATAD